MLRLRTQRNITVTEEGVQMLTKVRSVRKKLRMKQLDVADAVMVNRATYAGYELGRRTMPVDVAIRLARLFDTTVEELFG